jgi:HAD superfamily hydrolase (TIGR01509 family)
MPFIITNIREKQAIFKCFGKHCIVLEKNIKQRPLLLTMTKAILFDMDGVLVDSIAAWFNLFNKVMQNLENKTVTREEFDAHIWAGNFDIVVDRYFTVQKDKVRQQLDAEKSNFLHHIKPFPKAKETLAELKKTMKLAVLTNAHKAMAEDILKTAGINEFFDCIIGENNVEKGKPYPDMIFKALECLNLEKEDAVLVGDGLVDKEAAKNAGIRFIGMRLEAKERIENIEELLKEI